MEKSYLLVIIPILFLAHACKLEEVPGIPPGLQIKILKGNNQLGIIESPLDLPLIIQVLNEKGQPESGVPIVFDVSYSGNGTVNPTSIATDSNGIAETKWTLGSAEFTQMLIVKHAETDTVMTTFIAKVPNSGFVCGDSTWFDIRDGRSYKTIQIDEKCWMAENLNFGDSIKAIRESINVDNQIDKYCPGDNDNNCGLYGGLYKFDEIFGQLRLDDLEETLDPQDGSLNPQGGPKGICPEGWHIPNRREFQDLCFSVYGSNACNDNNLVNKRPDLKLATEISEFAGYMRHVGTPTVETNIELGIANVFWLAWKSGNSAVTARISSYNNSIDTLLIRRNPSFDLSIDPACCVRCVKD